MSDLVASAPSWLIEPSALTLESQAPAWLNTYRQQHWEAFCKQGLPTRQDERWKYTANYLTFLTENFSAAIMSADDISKEIVHQHRLQRDNSFLLVMVNGVFRPDLSDVNNLPENMLLMSLEEALISHPSLVEKNWPTDIDTRAYPFASLNAAMSKHGLFCMLPDNCKLAAPIHLLSLVVGTEKLILQPQLLFVLGKHSHLVLLEEYYSNVEQTYLQNAVLNFRVEAEAKLEYVKIQQEGQQGAHFAYTNIQQMQNSYVNYTNFSVGGAFARDDLTIDLSEQGAVCHTSGYYRLHRNNQYVDNHIDIRHSAPHTNSEMLYKGILDNKSCAVFNGRLLVAKDAQKILAYQANHNLLLSDQAEIYSKPELEIYADDVKCKHGATTGQINREALFYMRARGIPYVDAMNILLAGFADEIMQRITYPGIKLRVQEIMY